MTIALVPYPTAAETRAAAAGGNPRAQADLVGVEQRERWLERAASLELKLPSELPDLRGANLRITWDLRDRGGENWTVLRRRRKVLWRELAYWEGYERFAAVFEILHARYGDRLAGVRPTPGSETYLYGDKLNAWQNVDRLNRSLRNS